MASALFELVCKAAPENIASGIMRWVCISAMMLILIPSSALAQAGWGEIVKGGPFAEFRDGDWDMFRGTVARAADETPVGETMTWSNTATGSRGVVRVDKEYERADLGQCRDLSGQSSARLRTGGFHITVCRKPAEQWRIAS